MRSKELTKARWRTAAFILVPYAIQLLIVTHSEFSPAVEKETAEYRYEVIVGAAFPKNMLPVLGLLPILSGDPCRLKTTNLATGEVTTEWFDLVNDVCRKYPDICEPEPYSFRLETPTIPDDDRP